nr:FG-GAP repeat-containing protein [Tanacetum cinerariifolium]
MCILSCSSVALIANTQEIFFSAFYFLFSTSPCIRQGSLPSLHCYQQGFIPPTTFGVNVCNLHAKTDRALSLLLFFLFKLFVSLEDKEPNRSPQKNKDVSSLFQRVLLWPFADVFEDFPHNAHHREITISVSNYTLKHGDARLVIVGGRMKMQPHV